MTQKTINIAITTEYLQLQQLLKKIGVISTGGEAKIFLSQTPVLVNGEEENRRGRKLYSGDAVLVDNINYLITTK